MFKITVVIATDLIVPACVFSYVLSKALAILINYD